MDGKVLNENIVELKNGGVGESLPESDFVHGLIESVFVGKDDCFQCVWSRWSCRGVMDETDGSGERLKWMKIPSAMGDRDGGKGKLWSHHGRRGRARCARQEHEKSGGLDVNVVKVTSRNRMMLSRMNGERMRSGRV